MTDQRPRVGIVIVHFGEPAATLRCLRSLGDDPSPVKRRVVVVDNAAGSEQGLAPGAVGAEVEVVRQPDNPGFGAAVNRGVEALPERERESALVLLNNDVEVLPGFLEGVVDALREPGAGAAGGPVYLDRPGGELWYAGGRFRGLTGTVWQSREPGDAARPREVGFVPGAAFAVARAAWEAVGGFDPRFFLYHEDLDLCLRLRRAGWRLRFEPRMAVVHHLGGATGSAGRSALYLEQMSATRFLPHPSRLYRAYLAAVHTPYVASRALGLLAREGTGAWPRVRALLRGHATALGTVW